MSNSPVYPGSFSNCIDACANRTGCVDVSYVSGTCYLKSQVNAANLNSNIWGARMKNMTYPATTSIAAASTTASPSATAAPANLANYTYLGCAIEPYYYGYTSSNGGRALAAKKTTSSNMTLEMCATNCAGYTYFGTEYSTECYCDNAVGNNTSIDSTGKSCNMACGGNSTQMCGGSARLNLYELNGYPNPNLPTTMSSYVASTSTTSSSISSTSSMIVTSSSSVAGASAGNTTVTKAGAASGGAAVKQNAGVSRTTTTVTSYWSESTTAQSTMTGGSTVTMVDYVPQAGTTTTTTWLASGTPYTSTFSGSNTQSGTVIIGESSAGKSTLIQNEGIMLTTSGYTTVTTFGSVSSTQTTTLVTANQDTTGTVQIINPSSTAYDTYTSYWSGSATTSTVASPTNDSDGTVAVLIQSSTGYQTYSTTYGPSSSTTTVATPYQDQAGTVEVS